MMYVNEDDLEPKNPQNHRVVFVSGKVHPQKLTWNPKMEVWKIIFLFKGMMFMFHVSFRGR